MLAIATSLRRSRFDSYDLFGFDRAIRTDPPLLGHGRVFSTWSTACWHDLVLDIAAIGYDSFRIVNVALVRNSALCAATWLDRAVLPSLACSGLLTDQLLSNLLHIFIL